MNRLLAPGDGESILTHDAAQAFAMRWAESWNRRDVEAVLAHFHDDVIFTSPTALAVVGSASVRGKRALRDYWNTALARITSLHFSVERVLWDAQGGELAIIYTAAINENSRRVSENLKFDASGLVASAEVFHGVPA